MAAALALSLAAVVAAAAAIVAPAPLQPAVVRHGNLSAGAPADVDVSAHASSTPPLDQPVVANSTRPPQAPPPVVTSSWGPKRDPLYIVVPITIIYAVIFLTGIIGNISTCIVISRNKHMHTATNYYLFSLAVSDLLLLVSGLPPETYHMWSRYPYVFGETFCVIQGFAAETSSNATVLTITAFTVERYVAICHPFQSHAVSKPSRAVKYILLIWLLALCLAVPQAMAFGLVLYEPKNGRSPNPELTTCTVKRVVIPYAFQISTCVFFVAPMTLISVLYVLIGLQLRRSSVLSRRDASGSVRLKTHHQHHHQQQQQHQQDGRKNYPKNTHSKATRHVVKMLVAVVVAFFICWAPFHAQRLLAIYGESPTRSPLTVVLYNTLTYVSGVLYYLSTTVNPLLYHIMSHKFREAFKDTLARYLGRRRNREEPLHSSVRRILSGEKEKEAHVQVVRATTV
ncbi:pyrokinin-1 receptor-like [Schistocerca nitens]|uniref:pyrokinin-1 receptor-like n=1 Tax=Schistocerca nitens TaxID=7011 RepID=UPI0021174E29|nr:pyrokinin-1 receptor-like [Schistocerca nitens]